MFGPDGASATLSRKAEVEAQSGILIFRRVQGAHVSVPLRDVGISLVWGDSLKLDRRECRASSQPYLQYAGAKPSLVTSAR
jgi:hypothetical protein